jgi:putative oxidoreductase
VVQATVFPQLLAYADFALLALRLMVAVEFVPSGFYDLKDPAARAKGIDESKGFTIFIGLAEVVGGIALALGILTQLAAIGLILIGLGAIQKKIFVWKTGFWGKNSYGWHYDLMLMVMNLVILFTGGGKFVLV